MTLYESPIGAYRLYHQRITHSTFADAGAVVAWLGAMQGQDYAGTKWSFGLRLHDTTDAHLEQAIADGVIMRTWGLRGTLHYMSPSDIHWLLDLIASRQIASNARRYKQLELDEETLKQSTTIIAKALQNGEHLTRTELFTILEAHDISPAGQRGYYMLQRASLERVIYQGAVRRNETTFLALATGNTLPKDEALARLAHRYFTSHGPATLADFVYWSDLLVADARTGLENIKSELTEETINGQTYWMSPIMPQAPQQPVYLLSGFDEFVLGYKDRGAVLEPQFADRICPGGNGMFMSTIVSNGRVIGTWKRTLKKNSVLIETVPFYSFSDAEKDGILHVAQQYGAFLGLPVVLS